MDGTPKIRPVSQNNFLRREGHEIILFTSTRNSRGHNIQFPTKKKYTEAKIAGGPAKKLCETIRYSVGGGGKAGPAGADSQGAKDTLFAPHTRTTVVALFSRV